MILKKFKEDNYEYMEKPKKISWDKNIELKFENVIQSKDSTLFLSNFAKNGILHNQSSIDEATEFLTDFIVNSAVKAGNNGLSIEFKCPKKSTRPNWKFKKRTKTKIVHPKWHDATCESVSRRIKQTSYLLKKHPKNSYLRGCIQSETKQYKKLLKAKQKEYISQLFVDLDNLHSANPRGYMNLVKSLRDGAFDKRISDTTSFVSPDKWREHFSALLSPPVPTSPTEDFMSTFVKENGDKFKSNLDLLFTRSELLEGISSLDNNKASSFDQISNEMLKAGKLVFWRPILVLFNSILSSTAYPAKWKPDILSPLHKSGDKDDPNNYRGISVASCFGKLFNKLLQKRLEKLCLEKNFISDTQGSGKAGSRTSDHLLIVKFLVDKYVKKQGKKLFACFVDLRKAYDTVPRTKLFYTLLNDYSIGGNFLKILQEIYKGNQVFVKLTNGLLHPINTTIGLKQGCVFSPIIFNLFINKICNIFDESCSPVKINNVNLNSLLWADDLMLVSETPTGLQNAIDKMHSFYQSLDLQINKKKTKVIIFNKRGVKLDKKYLFLIDGVKLEITDQYQYLGLKLRPSGSMNLAVQELCDKASRAWFGISNIIFRNKRMEVDKVFGIFDSLVTPVAIYGSPFWLPYTLPKNSFKTEKNLFDSWEKFECEKLNQKCCRMVLSVNKKSSRLAVLGELARYPLFITTLSQCLNYRLSLVHRRTSTNLLGHVMTEMTEMADQGHDSWLTRVTQMESLLKLPRTLQFSKTSGKKISSILKSKFDRIWF